MHSKDRIEGYANKVAVEMNGSKTQVALTPEFTKIIDGVQTTLNVEFSLSTEEAMMLLLRLQVLRDVHRLSLPDDVSIMRGKPPTTSEFRR